MSDSLSLEIRVCSHYCRYFAVNVVKGFKKITFAEILSCLDVRMPFWAKGMGVLCMLHCVNLYSLGSCG